METSTKRGILLIGHGTRDPAGQAEFLDVVKQMADRNPGVFVQTAFLELVAPLIPEGIERMVAAGVTEVVAVPVLLLAAGHAKRDVPLALQAAAGRFPGVQFRLAEHLGCHQALIELSAQRYATARLLGRGQSDWPATESPPQDGLLLVVGRGSADPQTQAELAQFVEFRRVRTAVAAVQIGYLALARPSLDDVLEEVAKSAWRDVVVQPHLLFAGELLTRLRERVERAATEDPNRRWWLADHLGPDAAIVAALAARCTDARERAALVEAGRITNL